ncbi:MAG: general stress protein [Dehalococcoidia bacterium]|nr:general stress protein [Dehalococcoidia bacterium]
MTFKWTYLAAAVLGVAAIAVSVWGGGLAGASSHIYAIGLVAIGGLFIIWARMGRVPTRLEGSDKPFAGYPKNQVMGIFDTRQSAADALNDLRRSGFAQDDLSVYARESGARQLDSEGNSHGLAALAQRSIEHLVADVDDLKGYEDAVHRGGVVLAVLAPEEERREHVQDVFQRHQGHDVHYFGEMAVERLDVDRTRTRVD